MGFIGAFKMSKRNASGKEYQTVEITLWSKPLAKTRYTKAEIRKQPSDGNLITALFRKNFESYAEELGESLDASNDEANSTPLSCNAETKSEPVIEIMTEPTSPDEESEPNFDLGSQALEALPPEFQNEEAIYEYYSADTQTDEDEEEQADQPKKKKKKPKKKKIRLKVRIDNTLYDYSELEEDALEQEAEKLINSDGYYNEVMPRDAFLAYDDGKKRIAKPVAIVVTALIIVGVALAYMLKSLF